MRLIDTTSRPASRSVGTPSGPVLRADGKKATGVAIYRGPSMLDGAPIVAVALFGSSNTKTGNMVQTYILREDVSPVAAIREGLDASICGDCVHRGVIGADGRPGKGTRTCYVNIGQGPTIVHKSLAADLYPAVPSRGLFAGRFVRLGTYGDPAAVPFEVWADVLHGTVGHNGYTHQWRACDARFRALCMASADTPKEREEARAAGWRVFRTRPDTSKLAGEFVCPASAEAGYKLQCAACKACGGTSSKARADVVITVHGGSAVAANARRRGMLAA